MIAAPPPAPPPLNESPEGLADPPATQIVDANLTVWTISSTSQVAKNGVNDANTANVTFLYYHAHQVYYKGTGGWFFWNGTAWVATTDPTVVAGFYVATNGIDTNPGTLIAPFATFSAAKIAMRNSATIKTTYIRAGTYTPGTDPDSGGNSILYLDNRDAGTTWSYYPTDGVNSAIINGSGYRSATTRDGIAIVATSNVTINGLQLQNFTGSAIIQVGTTVVTTQGWFWIPNPAAAVTGSTIKNNMILNVTPRQDGGAIESHGQLLNSSINNNVVGVSDNDGIRFGLYQYANANLTIANNFIYSCNLTVEDSGAIYCFQQGNIGVGSGYSIRYNYIRDFSHLFNTNTWGSVGIYMDEGSTGVSITGNVLTGTVPPVANPNTNARMILINGGQNIVATGNIFDLGPSGHMACMTTFTVTSPVLCTSSGDQFNKNIVIGGYTGTQSVQEAGTTIGPGCFNWTSNADGSAAGNVFHNYVGTDPASTNNAPGGAAGDTTAVFKDPLVSGWNYIVAAASPARAAPTNFTQPTVNGIAWGAPGFWGPPGFVIPQTGTPPSCPH